MRAIWALALNSWQENQRGRFWQLTVVFTTVTVFLSLVLSLMAADQQLRALEDFGLSLIELLALAGAVHAAATAILRELEMKTIYLILTRPVTRGQYLLGRFAGLMASVASSMALMAAAHLAILLAQGGGLTAAYAWALLGAWLKVLIMAALTLFLAVFASSTLTALVIAGVLWSLGHFLPEIRFMIRWGSASWSALPLNALSYVIPDLQLYNLRDRLSPLAGMSPEAALWKWLGYTVAYAGCWLFAATRLLKTKEF